MARIKICGLKRAEDVQYVNALLPDYTGFILSPGFKRSIDISLASQLASNLSPEIKRVGVFVDEPIANVLAAVADGVVDIVQLHGNESVDYCKGIDAPIIKVLKPDGFHLAPQYEPYVDFFLFDSGTGTGVAFDWSLLPVVAKPFFLAGGLGAENLEQAIVDINPFAVDLSSSVETDGVKDYEKIKQVIDIVRSTK